MRKIHIYIYNMQATQILEEGADPQMLYTCYGRTAAHRSTQSGSI